jgi:uncharacterized membrane-anchored protein
MGKYIGKEVIFIKAVGLSILPFMFCMLLVNEEALYIKFPVLIAGLFVSDFLASKFKLTQQKYNVESLIFTASLVLVAIIFYSLEKHLPIYIDSFGITMGERHIFVAVFFIPFLALKIYRYFSSRSE